MESGLPGATASVIFVQLRSLAIFFSNFENGIKKFKQDGIA